MSSYGGEYEWSFSTVRTSPVKLIVVSTAGRDWKGCKQFFLTCIITWIFKGESRGIPILSCHAVTRKLSFVASVLTTTPPALILGHGCSLGLVAMSCAGKARIWSVLWIRTSKVLNGMSHRKKISEQGESEISVNGTFSVYRRDIQNDLCGEESNEVLFISKRRTFACT